MAEEVVEVIEKDRFDLLTILLRSLQKLFSPQAKNVKDWQRSLVELFFKDLSTPEMFRLIRDRLQQLETIELEDLKALAHTLLYFSPEFIPFLMQVILQSSSDRIQQMVSVVIVHLSQRDMGPLEIAADTYGEKMGNKLLTILNRLQGDRVNKILFKMCDHSSDLVRRKAIKELIDRDAKYAQKLFPLIDDQSKDIRTSILTAFASLRSSVLEKMMLDYLEENSTKKDQDHILACYKTLGRCGSNTSVPYLRSILLEKGWNSFMGIGKLFFRENAAIALALLDTPEAKGVLQEASESRSKVIRKAYERTKSITVSGGKKND